MSPRLQGMVLVVAAAIAAGGGFAFYRTTLGSAPAKQELAADIALPKLEGGDAHLSEYRGKLVLVNFWATWCAPCMSEVPLLVELQQRYGTRGFQILGPAMDDPEAVRGQLARLGVHYPVFVGEQAVPAAMDGLGDTLGALPFSVLISAEGYVLFRKHGEFSREELTELVEKHLPPAAPAA